MACSLVAAAPAGAVVLPAGFHQVAAITGLDQPTAVRFAPAPDTTVFVAEKRGVIRALRALGDPAPVTVADLRTETLNWWDRGLLGLAVDPAYPERPYVYALYTRDALPGGAAPHWGEPGEDDDDCSDVAVDDCTASGRLVRITVDPESLRATTITPLVTDWCQQDPSHSLGDLQFGPDGMLYAGAGDAASFAFADYGQSGNACGDPPAAAGTGLEPPAAEGGALRAQDARTPADPTGLDGSIIRVDPDTGLGAPGNPLSGPDDNARRIVAYGLRNPFRFSFRPGTGELYIGDVGWNGQEEIDTLEAPGTAPVNFGWPCYEGGPDGSAPELEYASAGLSVCADLYAHGPGAVRAPAFSYPHSQPVGLCDPGGSSISGIAFGGGTDYPRADREGMFFADYARGCIWHMALSGGAPDASTLETFARYEPGEAAPVDLQSGPGGDLYLADIANGTVWAIQHDGNPTARAVADVTESRSAPLTVHFDAGASTDSGGTSALTYAWDLDGDGVYDDATGVAPSRTYEQEGSYAVRVQVTDAGGASSVSDRILITPGNTKPRITLDAPSPALAWSVGDPIAFSAAAVDDQDGAEPPARMNWRVLIHHCPSDCHAHYLTAFSGVDRGSLTAPDHEYPSYLSLTVTVTDSAGLSASRTVDLHPTTVLLCVLSRPAGRIVTLNGRSGASPLTATVIRGSRNAVGAPSPQQDAGAGAFTFERWSDGGARTHQVTAAADRTLTAAFAAPPDGDPAPAPARPGPSAEPATADVSRQGARVRVESAIIRHVVKRHGVRAGAGGTVTLRVRCAGRAACSTVVTLESDGQRIGGARVHVAGRHARLVRVPLTRAARALLARRRAIPARSVVELRATGRLERVTTRFVLRAARRR